jgi:ABC-type bacteriocin/lantibiotic exporter with double-glycine peptidase domain
MSEYFLFWLSYIFAVVMFGVLVIACFLFVIWLMFLYEAMKDKIKKAKQK